MNIAILGCTGLKNRGVDALVTSTLSGLSEIFPEASMALFTWSPEYDRGRLENDALDVVDYPYLPKQSTYFMPPAGLKQRLLYVARRILRMLQTTVATISRGSFKPPASNRLASALKSYDLVLITGGDIYSSDYGSQFLGYCLSMIHTASNLNIPVALVGHTIGHFADVHSKTAWLGTYQRISFLTTRDKLTYDYLKEINGLPANTYIAADVAFNLSKANHYPRPVKNNSPLVALSISAGIAKWTGLSSAEYTQAWLEIIKNILINWKCEIILIPHVQEAYGDDRIIQTKLHRALAFDARVSIAAADLSASEYKAMISETDFLIAERMHAAIAGISCLVPTVIASYSLKAQGLANEAYGEDIHTNSAPIYQASDYRKVSKVIHILDRAWHAREELGKSLMLNVPSLIDRASDNFTLLSEWYHQRCR